ncbi:MAG: alpha-hydroxy acid oxidase [Halopseudomonas yangmingensis]
MTDPLKGCLNIADLHRRARSRLPFPIYQYLERGADDEYSLRNNTSAFEHYQLQPRALADVSQLDTRTRVFGCDIDWPLIMAPTGMTKLFHPDGELAAVRAAARAGTLYCASTFSSVDLESIAAASPAPKMFQVYVVTDQQLNDQLIERARNAGYAAMCLTVDTVVGGNREEVARAGMNIPPKLSPKSALQFAARPRWVWNYLSRPKWDLANLSDRIRPGKDGKRDMASYLGGLLERRLNWAHAERMIRQWGGPFAIKGIMSAADARRAVEMGASALFISNHGGRQLDSTPAPIELVAEIRAAVGPKIDIIVDGGIRRGTHILKALAMGASACSVGRPYLYGLAAGGEDGAVRALQMLRSELERNMILAGCPRLSEIGPDLVRNPAPRWDPQQATTVHREHSHD